ncbi:hypothetical protein D0B54_10175 [Solimonas sp. K1W22B-7]|uniref:alpha/beta hydrolase family protein n=1 Tax=Solimonas sp. K1W22B-7 TaxID=2303331 RepID=UPI000E32E679|nr:hypothetical protein [Solimonas sp. K1W22B-7]AXQ29030.1 hypothetical protein D0B54_10175 [Solimonas sp. K1W22B-7]
MEPTPPRQWEPLSLVPILAGLCWLLPQEGWGWLLWALIPGILLLASGTALLLFPGDPRISAYMALGSAVGVLFFLPAWIAGSFGSAVLALAGSVAGFMTAGRAALLREPQPLEAPAPDTGPRMDIKVGMDEAVLGYFVGGARLPGAEQAQQVCRQAEQMLAVYRQRGFDRDPSLLHAAPPPPSSTNVQKARHRGQDYELLRFDSGFAPDAGLPGAAAWKGHAANNECHVRLLRHPGPPRPWLLCIHGYRMGDTWLDFSLFSPRWLHQRMGFNIIQPVLPLHGPRRGGARSGDHYLDGDPLDLVHAQSQALWDLRRSLAWLRHSEGKPRVGVLGYSLGGYNTALLASYERQLDFAVAIIPVMDFASALMRFLPPAHLRYYRHYGLDEQRYREILQVVSPLARAPLLPRERLHVVAATADRIVLPQHPLMLGRHWNVPVTWYQGSHLSIRYEREPGQVLRHAALSAGWPVT